MLDVLSIGNANIDIYNNKQFLGGSANNFAVACAKLGLKSGFLGFVGNDKNGRLIINNLKKNNVKSFVKIVNEKTGTVKILSEGFNKKFEKIIGANENLKKLDLKPYLKEANHFHFATPPIELLKKIPFNLSVSVDSGSKLSEYSIKELKPYLKNVRIFFATEDELKKITNKSYKMAAKELIQIGVKIVAIKRKTTGVYIKSKDEECNINYINGKIVDATGGGDAFASAFLNGIILGKSLRRAGEDGIISSYYKIQRLGAQNSPKIKKINDFVKNIEKYF